MVAGEVLHGQVGPLAAHGIEEHGGAEGSIRPCVLVVDGEERGEAVGEVLLQAGEREVQLVDDSVTQLVAEDELVTPHVQDVSCEVLLRDDLGRTLVADDLGEEFGEDVVGLLREGRRPEDPTTVQLGRRVVDALGHVVGDDHLEVVGQRHRLRQAVRHPFEHARVHDLLHRIPVLGPDGVVLVDDRDPPLALGPSGRGVVIAEAGRAPEHHEENRDAEGDVPTQSHGRRKS